MGSVEEPFVMLAVKENSDDFSASTRKTAIFLQPPLAPLSLGACIGRLEGFDLDDRPLLSGLAQFPGEVVLARTTVPLAQRMIGGNVLVLYEERDHSRPIIVGVLQERILLPEASEKQQSVSVQADGECYVLSAEREIVLRCGAASITLTRAGKVIIKGNYILSRSTGYNKIKGSAVDIN